MVDRFFLPAGFEPKNGVVELDALESAHAVESRRLRSGAAVELLDGEGLVAAGRLVRADRRGCRVEVESVVRRSRDGRRVTIALSVPRGPRMDTFLDGATQLGIERVIPVVFERSVAGREDLSPTRVERWKRVAREAAKQSGYPFVPVIEAVQPLARIETAPDAARHFLLQLRDGAPSLGASLASHSDAVRILVGPEGGPTPAELERVEKAGNEIVHLGPSVLRIEMAALVAAALARLGPQPS